MKGSMTAESSKNQLAQRYACIDVRACLQSCCVIEPLTYGSRGASFVVVLIFLRCGITAFQELDEWSPPSYKRSSLSS
jgi:hypothetical protein